MDNLVLIRAAASLERSLVGAGFGDIHQEDSRFRLLFLRDDRPLTVWFSLEPDRPWIGRVSRRLRSKRSPAPGPFVVAVRRSLRGSVLLAIDKPAAERRVLFRFSDGNGIVLELNPRGANALVLDDSDRVLATARKAGRRNLPHERYRPLPFPKTRANPFACDPAAIDRIVGNRMALGETAQQALQRGFLGVDRDAADLVQRESRRTGGSPGEILSRRLAELIRGEADPVIEWAEEGGSNQDEAGVRRLWPWNPDWPAVAPQQRVALEDPAATAGLFYERVERESSLLKQHRRLLSVLESEIRRQRELAARVAADAGRFEDPERFRKQGEALLSGLNQARRDGDRVWVPDPYDSEALPILVGVPRACSLTRAAELCFERHRRAKRGLLRTRDRARQLADRRRRLGRIREEHSGETDGARVESLRREMQQAGIPVGLETPRPGRGAPPPGGRPRLEGVRMFTTSEGDSVLIGKSGRDNDRLTFRLASPEDFWLHALGVHGAHVIVRNDTGAARPRTASIREAAAAAAWYSAAREQAHVDVQWTRRKLVRRIRGAPPGTVQVKRSETVRVRPRCPPEP